MDLAYALWIINPAAQYILSADGQSIAEWIGPGIQPNPAQIAAAWATAQTQIAARQAKQTLITQHTAALATLYATVSGDANQIQTDLTLLKTITAALAGGTIPTAAQQAIIDRVLIRLLIILNSE